ncbi:MAG: hypothetical protein QM756_22800 [Polyangiaceae bacterium]
MRLHDIHSHTDLAGPGPGEPGHQVPDPPEPEPIDPPSPDYRDDPPVSPIDDPPPDPRAMARAGRR